MNGFVVEINCDTISNSVWEWKKSFVQHLGIHAQENDFYVTLNGRKVDEKTEARVGLEYRFHPRLVGGKGGFGSMLRALGAQIEKTTNREACRDLSGRRMRDVNNEKKLKEWVEKAAEREQQVKEKEEEKKKKTTEAKYFFDSTAYDQQKEKIQGDFEDALRQALKNPNKRKAEKKVDPPPKDRDWFGIDLDDTDSSDDDNEDFVPRAAKKPRLHDDDGAGPSWSDGGNLKEFESTSHDESNSDDSKGDGVNGDPASSSGDNISNESKEVIDYPVEDDKSITQNI